MIDVNALCMWNFSGSATNFEFHGLGENIIIELCWHYSFLYLPFKLVILAVTVLFPQYLEWIIIPQLLLDVITDRYAFNTIQWWIKFVCVCKYQLVPRWNTIFGVVILYFSLFCEVLCMFWSSRRKTKLLWFKLHFI